jgi:hypothetical protein
VACAIQCRLTLCCQIFVEECFRRTLSELGLTLTDVAIAYFAVKNLNYSIDFSTGHQNCFGSVAGAPAVDWPRVIENGCESDEEDHLENHSSSSSSSAIRKQRHRSRGE